MKECRIKGNHIFRDTVLRVRLPCVNTFQDADCGTRVPLEPVTHMIGVAPGPILEHDFPGFGDPPGGGIQGP